MICTVCQITIYVGLSETVMKLTSLKVFDLSCKIFNFWCKLQVYQADHGIR